MKYPQNEEQAKKAIEFYDDFHSNGLPDISINIERDINTNGETSISDVEYYKTLERCHDAHVFIKSMHFETGAMDEDCEPLSYTIISLKDFIAASDAIKAYASITENLK